MVSKITYSRIGDYNIPNLYIPKDTNYRIGKYGKAHLRHIKQYKKEFYTVLLLDGKVNSYLHSIDEKAQNELNSIIRELAKKENITEKLKADNQMEWVARMNNIKHRGEEIIYQEYVYI